MEISALVARRNKDTPLLIALCFFGCGVFMFAKTKKPVFTWLRLNDTGNVFIIGGISLALYFIFKYINSKPEIIINNAGIQKRKFIFLKMETIGWDNIYYYYFEDQQNFDKSIKSLGIKLKNLEKEIVIDLKGLDKSISEIAEAIEPFANKYRIIKLL